MIKTQLTLRRREKPQEIREILMMGNKVRAAQQMRERTAGGYHQANMKKKGDY